MGKATGFLDYERQDVKAEAPKERINIWSSMSSLTKKKTENRVYGGLWSTVLPGRYDDRRNGQVDVRNNLVPNGMIWPISGNWQLRGDRLHKTNNFREFTSRVCPALCEKACTCNLNGDPVAATFK